MLTLSLTSPQLKLRRDLLRRDLLASCQGSPALGDLLLLLPEQLLHLAEQLVSLGGKLFCSFILQKKNRKK